MFTENNTFQWMSYKGISRNLSLRYKKNEASLEGERK